MTEILMASLFGFPLLTAHPVTSHVPVSNTLTEQSVSGIYLVLPEEEELIQLELTSPIQPGNTVLVDFPWGYANRVILTTDSNDSYFVSGFPASSAPDTIKVALALKEFGGIFDRIQGNRPIVMKNASHVAIASLSAEGPALAGGDLLNGSVLMPGDILRLWVDSQGQYTVRLFDTDGNPSEEMQLVPDPDTVYSFTNSWFFNNGTVRSTPEGRFELTAVNCISSEEITALEVFDEAGFSIGYFDFSNSPLETWDMALVHTDFPPSFITCTDGYGRTYTLEEPDSVSGYFEFDLLALDFDFSFPEGR